MTYPDSTPKNSVNARVDHLSSPDHKMGIRSNSSHDSANAMSLRSALTAGLAAGAFMLGGRTARATVRHESAVLPSVVSTPPRMWGPEAPVAFTPDPDILSLDTAFDTLIYGNAALECVWRATPEHQVRWLEGPAWCSEGRFLLVSDVVGSVQYRFLPGERAMTVFRRQSYHANGNTFDREGRLLTCEHDLRRVIRWEHDGSCTVMADRFEGKSLNSPNDIVVGPDGGIWFADPAYGDRLWGGHPNAPTDDPASNNALKRNLDAEVATEIGGRTSQQSHLFHIDPTRRILTADLSENELAGPNGLCFSPDGKTF